MVLRVPLLSLQLLGGVESGFGGGEGQQMWWCEFWNPLARRARPHGDSVCHPLCAVPSLHRGDAISYARIHQQQKQMDEEKLTGTLEGQAL